MALNGSSSPTAKGLEDHFEDDLQVREHLVVPESEHLEASAFEPCSAAIVVALLLGMLTPINFNDELSLEADKVYDVSP